MILFFALALLIFYLIAGLTISRWYYLREHDLDRVDALLICAIWPVIVVCRSAITFGKWFYQRPEETR